MENNERELYQNNNIENDIKNNELKNKKDIKSYRKKRKKQKSKYWIWPLTVLLLTLILSTCFSLISEFLLSGTGILISILILLIFILVAVLCDMIGVSATAAETEPFVSMSSRKIKGAKLALRLVKNSDKVSSICCDVIGDICGILSGAVGATIVALIAVSGNIENILIASLVSAIIASLTVFLKALAKSLAIKHSNRIIFVFAKFLTFFKFGKK